MVTVAARPHPARRIQLARRPGARRRGGLRAVGRSICDLEPRLRDAVEHPAAPLDHDDRPREVDVEVVELEQRCDSRYASTCTSGAPPTRLGCVRASTKVGLVTGPRTPRPSPIPRVSVVLPAPSGPLSTTRSPGARGSRPSSMPSVCISAAVCTCRGRGRPQEPGHRRPTVDPLHAGADPGHDLVVDRAGRLRPVVGRRDARRRVAEQHDLVADRDRRASPTSTTNWSIAIRPPPGSAPADRRPVPRLDALARDALGVSERARARASSPRAVR